jgi:hypothetical protein
MKEVFMHGESLSSMILAFTLLLVVFMCYPWFVACKAKEGEKLKAFVLAIFGPFFSWVFLFMLVNLVTHLTLRYNPFEESTGWVFVYLALQASFFVGFKNFKLLK